MNSKYRMPKSAKQFILSSPRIEAYVYNNDIDMDSVDLYKVIKQIYNEELLHDKVTRQQVRHIIYARLYNADIDKSIVSHGTYSRLNMLFDFEDSAIPLRCRVYGEILNLFKAFKM